MTSFNDLGLAAPLLRALAEEKYENPTPIQEQAIPHLIAGRDLLGLAQTGTGKTAAFALPILHYLLENKRRAPAKGMRVLVLAPTRELAIQIADSFKAYGRHLPYRVQAIFGGVGQNPQVTALARGLDVLIATPGRLLDLANQGFARFDAVECFVLDEADRMFDMGFIHDLRKIVALLPAQRQTLLFSATMPGPIAQLANGVLTDPVRVQVTPPATTVEKIEQCLMPVAQSDKRALLAWLIGQESIARGIVFTRTKHGANRVAEHLEKAGIGAAAIHGNKSQNARQAALGAFRDGKLQVLVATDIAARGIDVDGITHVVNFDLPNEPESYVHRIGRTARAGATGKAISFCAVDERAFLRDIEKTIRQPIPLGGEHPYLANANEAAPPQPVRHGRPPRGGQGHGGQGYAAHGQGGRGHGGQRGRRAA